jgi:tetratricopeptide (TPR) repeat protein
VIDAFVLRPPAMHPGCVSAEVASAFAAGLLEGEELSVVEAHIDVCGRCRKLLSEAAQAMSAGSVLAEAGSAPGAHERTSSPGSLLPGKIIGRYVVGEVIGTGAMGVVYAAHDPELGRRVALKVMRSQSLPSGRSAEQLLRREAKAMARLSHPNVVAAYDLLVHEELLLVAMELVEGVTLRQWLREKPRGWREIVDVFVLAGRGLAAAHAAGIVHRDFKPENVLCGADGRVCVSDFGLSRLGVESIGLAAPRQTHTTSSGATSASASVVGTPRYMAPEQRAGKPATPQSDQFSFCVALHEALYGVHPSAAARGKNGAADEGRRPAGRVPRWLRAAMLRGLRESPEERFGAIDDLLAVLSRRRGATWRRYALAATVVAAGAAGLGWHHATQARLEACRGARVSVGAAWGEEPRQAVAKAFAAVGTPYAAIIEPRVENAVDRYVRAWTDTRTQVCTDLAQTNMAALDTDARMLCLDQRRRELHAVVDELRSVRTSGETASGRVAVELLQSPENCARAHELERRGPHVESAATSAQAEGIRADLARFEALVYFEQEVQAAAVAERARDAARSLGDPTLLGQALLSCGYIHSDSDAAIGELYEAIAVADTAGDDRTRVRAWANLLFLVPMGKIDPAQAPYLFEQGMAAVTRMGGDEACEAHLRMAYGVGLWKQRQYPAAREQLELAVALWRRAGQRLSVAHTLEDLALVYAAQGKYTESLRAFEAALDDARELLGDQHPIISSYLGNEASMLFLEYGEPARALEAAQRAVAIVEATRPERPGLLGAQATEGEALLALGRAEEARAALAPVVAAAPTGVLQGWNAAVAADLGRAYLALGRPEEALPPLEQALAGSPDPEYAADARFGIARALTALGRDPKRAVSLAAEAKTILESLDFLTPLQRSKHDEVVEWLEEPHHAPGPRPR